MRLLHFRKLSVSLLALSILLFGGAWQSALAQRNLPVFDPNAPQQEAQDTKEAAEDEIVNAIPKVISAHLPDSAQAKQMDRVYYNLQVSLWNIAQTDKVHHKKLMDQMEPFLFRYSRRLAEFKPSLDLAMEDLNINKKSMKDVIEKAHDDIISLRVSLADEQKQVVDKIWKEKKAEFQKLADQYFMSQFKFLKTYHSLVKFIMEKAGGYYYDSDRRKVSFYDVVDYTNFGSSVDVLNKTIYNQKVMLQEIEPLQPVKDEDKR